MFQLKNLSFAYSGYPVLQDINWSIASGDFWVMLGQNGSGKTTLLKLLARLLKASAGTVALGGIPIERYSVRALSQKIAYVPQRQDIIFDFPLFDMVLMGRNPYHFFWQSAGEKDNRIVLDILQQTRLVDLKERLFSELSGGEQQRALIARAMAQKTEMILLDEPLANLDMVHQFEIMDMLSHLNQMQKITIVMVLHDLSLAKSYAREALLLKKGRIIDAGLCSSVLATQNIRTLFDLDSHFQIDEYGGVRKTEK
ncbi:MAG: ABC transporter ATP-binding protein [Bacteroidales bacterium]|jgi:iron complex transport system ATP-binding protein|nr:ABC transporter ATP-binding protein [Bacteroidales bacterium]